MKKKESVKLKESTENAQQSQEKWASVYHNAITSHSEKKQNDFVTLNIVHGHLLLLYYHKTGFRTCCVLVVSGGFAVVWGYFYGPMQVLL